MASLSRAPRERNLLERVGVAISVDATDAKRNPVKAIRRMCLQCSGGSPALAESCPSSMCPLFAFRLGRNPYRAAARSSANGTLAPEAPTPLAMG